MAARAGHALSWVTHLLRCNHSTATPTGTLRTVLPTYRPSDRLSHPSPKLSHADPESPLFPTNCP
jgi:hypothetical protein